MKKLIFFGLFLLPFISKAQSYDLYNYYLNSTVQNEIRIETNIPFTPYHMPTIRIEGYNYGGATTIGLNLVWYVWENSFWAPSVSSFGGYTPEVYLSVIDEKVNIFLKSGGMYYGRFKVTAYAHGLEQSSWFSNWNVSDEEISGDNLTLVPYYNKFRDHVEVDGTLNAGIVSGSKGLFNQVGVGTTTPEAKLNVVGDIKLGTSAGRGYNLVQNYMSLGETEGGASTILGNNVKVTDELNNRVQVSVSPVDGSHWIKLNYYQGITFNRIGASPVGTQHFDDAGELMRITNDGNIGIGNNSPQGLLHLFKKNSLSRTSVQDLLYLGTTHDNVGYTGFGTGIVDFRRTYQSEIPHAVNRISFIELGHSSLDAGGAITFETKALSSGTVAPVERMRIDNEGRVGIGKINPTQKLDVNGNAAVNGKVFIGDVDPGYTGSHLLAVNGSAIFTKVKVKLYGSQWPDYVFEPGYKLRSLPSLEKFINQNKHLPDVPSAKKIEDEGIDIGNNQAILLKKIEELTLYVIDLQKQIDELKKK